MRDLLRALTLITLSLGAIVVGGRQWLRARRHDATARRKRALEAANRDA